jgi:hypothetical protein
MGISSAVAVDAVALPRVWRTARLAGREEVLMRYSTTLNHD